MVDECIFCQIAAGDATADIVADGGEIIFFRDISPKAAVHIVGIPKKHIASLDKLESGDAELLARLLEGVVRVARDAGLAEDGYRVVCNVGRNAGQEVQHLHIHIMGGEALGPLRC
jgi:histidine triad (HIT) family protein